MENTAERFVKTLNTSMHPRNKHQILYGIAFSLPTEEIAKARVSIGQRLRHLQEVDAPEVIIDNEKKRVAEVNALLDKVEKSRRN